MSQLSRGIKFVLFLPQKQSQIAYKHAGLIPALRTKPKRLRLQATFGSQGAGGYLRICYTWWWHLT